MEVLCSEPLLMKCQNTHTIQNFGCLGLFIVFNAGEKKKKTKHICGMLQPFRNDPRGEHIDWQVCLSGDGYLPSECFLCQEPEARSK